MSSIELQKFVRDLSLCLSLSLCLCLSPSPSPSPSPSLSLSPVFRIVVFDVTVEVKTNG